MQFYVDNFQTARRPREDDANEEIVFYDIGQTMFDRKRRRSNMPTNKEVRLEDEGGEGR